MNAYSIAATTPLSFGLQPSSRDNSQQKRKARILVVDDDPGLLRLLTIRLRAENYEVEAVESAAAWRGGAWAYFSNSCQFGSFGGAAGMKPNVFSKRLA